MHSKVSKGGRATHYFFWVDFLRGVAAVAVLVFHYQHFLYTQADTVTLPDPGLLPFHGALALFYDHGDAAVLLFWVISGFVFASVYLNRASRVTAGEFFIHRLARLYPLHFVTLITIAVLQIFSLRLLGHFQIYGHNDVYHFLLNLGFISAWGLEKGFSFNAPVWSVSVEVFIYLVFFLTIPLLSRKLGGALVMTALFGLLLALHAPEPNFWLCGLCFYLGCCVFRIWEFLDGYGAIPPVTVAVIAVAAAMLAGAFLRPLATHPIANQLILFPPVVLVFAALDRIDRPAIGFRVRTVGNLTYSLYLWHVPVQVLTLAVLQFLAVGSRVAYSKAFFCAYLLVMFGLAWASFRFLESPGRRLVRAAPRYARLAFSRSAGT